MAGTDTHDAAWFFDSLWRKGQARCDIPIVDTVVVDSGAAVRWLFKSKTGEILKKKTVDQNQIRDAFLNVAFEDTKNTEHNVCVVRFPDDRRTIDHTEFKDFMKNFSTGLSGVVAVQAYIQPKGGNGTAYINTYHIANDKGKIVTSTRKCPRHLAGNSAVREYAGPSNLRSKETRINNLLDGLTARLVRYLESLRRVRVIHCEIEYVVDSTEAAFMVFGSNIQTVKGPAASDLRLAGLVGEGDAYFDFLTGKRTSKAELAAPKATEVKWREQQKYRKGLADTLNSSGLPESVDERVAGMQLTNATGTLMKSRPGSPVRAALQSQSASRTLPDQFGSPVAGSRMRRGSVVRVDDGNVTVEEDTGAFALTKSIVGGGRGRRADASGGAGGGAYPTPFACRGDFCTFDVEDPECIKVPTALDVAKQFFTRDEIEGVAAALSQKAMSGGQSGSLLGAGVDLGGPHDADGNPLLMISQKSVTEARAAADKMAQAQGMAPGSVLGPAGKRQRKPAKGGMSRLMQPTQTSASRVEWSRQRGQVAGGASNYYEHVYVCQRCYSVYQTLDEAREMIWEKKQRKRKKKLEKIKPRAPPNHAERRLQQRRAESRAASPEATSKSQSMMSSPPGRHSPSPESKQDDRDLSKGGITNADDGEVTRLAIAMGLENVSNARADAEMAVLRERAKAAEAQASRMTMDRAVRKDGRSEPKSGMQASAASASTENISKRPRPMSRGMYLALEQNRPSHGSNAEDPRVGGWSEALHDHERREKWEAEEAAKARAQEEKRRALRAQLGLDGTTADADGLAQRAEQTISQSAMANARGLDQKTFDKAVANPGIKSHHDLDVFLRGGGEGTLRMGETAKSKIDFQPGVRNIQDFGNQSLTRGNADDRLPPSSAPAEGSSLSTIQMPSTASLPSIGPGRPASSGTPFAEEPAADPDPSPPSVEQRYDRMLQHPTGYGWRGEILLVDHDKAAVVSAVDKLAEQGYAVTIAADGTKALPLTRGTNFDAVLIARDLISISGIEVTRILRQREAGVARPDRLPIIAFTDRTEPHDLRAYMEAGMDGCVSKPVNTNALLDTVAAAVPPPEEGAPMDWDPEEYALAMKTGLMDGRSGQDAAAFAAQGTMQNKWQAERPGANAYGATKGGGKGRGKAGAGASQRGRGRGRGRGGGRGRAGGNKLADSMPSIHTAGITSMGIALGKGNSSTLVGPTGKKSGGLYAAEAGDDSTMQVPVPESDAARHGIFQMDSDTAFPYVVLGEERDDTPLFHFVVVQDMYDTSEVWQIFFKAMVTKYPGLQVLLWNYPGQAFTEWRRDITLNNQYLAGCLHALMGHVGLAGTGEFSLEANTAPFYLMGVGNGGNIATAFALQYSAHYHNLRSLLLVNGFSHIDAHFAGVMHDCLNVFSCTPESRPDLPVYFYSRFLFSPSYLNRVGAPLALNLYTAVNNPITLEGRKQLATGALAHVDLRQKLRRFAIPILLVASQQDALIKSDVHVSSFVEARGGEERSIKQALASKKPCVVWFKAGHEVKQEAKRPLGNLVEQLVTGYHERHDVTFLPLMPPEPETGVDGAAQKPPQKLTKSERAAERARQRAAELSKSVTQSTPGIANAMGKMVEPRPGAGLPGQGGAGRMFEDVFLDNVVKSLKKPGDVAAAAHQSSSAPSDGAIQAGDFPAALEAAPPLPPGYSTSKSKAHGGGKGGTGSTSRFRGSSRPDDPAFEREENTVYQAGDGSKIYPTDVPEVKEYMQWRVRRNKKRLQRLEAAVIAIQRAWRAYIARTLVQRMREQRASLLIQRIWRGELGRRAFENRKKQDWAVRLVQRHWRGHSARELVKRILLEEASATDVQRVFRGFIARRFVNVLRAARHDAAVVVQSMFRRRRAVLQAWRLRDERNAAISVQRVWRGRLGRARAARERDRFLFSKSQSMGIEFGRQMLMEHKLHGTKLQSEVALLTKEKLATEERVEHVLREISQFEAGVRALEKEMTELSRAEVEAAGTLDDEAKLELRENKMRLDKEFSAMLVKISDRRETLRSLESKLQTIDKARQAKKEELKDLERKLVVLLEEQQAELEAIKLRQQKKGERLVDDAVAAVKGELSEASHQRLMADGSIQLPPGARKIQNPDGTSRYVDVHGNPIKVAQPGRMKAGGAGNDGKGGGGGGPTPQQRAEANALMNSTETMMKFGFMSMSLTYFSSLNMIRAMKKVGTANTLLANPLVGGSMNGDQPLLPSSAAELAENGSAAEFNPATKPGQLPADGPIEVARWTVRDVGEWLKSLSLGQYRDQFSDAAVDGAFLYDLTDEDLKNTLGIEHALHRKKILNSVRRLKKQDAERQARDKLIAAGAAPGAYPAAPAAGGGGGVPPLALGNGQPTNPALQALEHEEEDAALRAAAARAGSEGELKLDTLLSWVRHGKAQKLTDAFAHLPDQPFDSATVVSPYLEDYGTQYEDALARRKFHMNSVDDYGNSLLVIAAQNGQMKIAQLLIRKGANPNHQNNQGNTALHYAMEYNFYDLGAWLADPDLGRAKDDVLNKFGMGPYDGLKP